jgi:RNA methyltransferase, TrmH family
MITSTKNQKIQQVRSLLGRRVERTTQHAFVAEGVRLVEEALQAGWPARQVFFSSSVSERGRHTAQAFAALGAEVEEVSDEVMQALTDTETPQGLLAVLAEHNLPLNPVPDFLLLADGVRDPGNLGTLLRSAAAAGVQAVFLPPGTVDAFSPKVLRSAMGAHFRLPIRIIDWAWLDAWRQQVAQPWRIFLAEAENGTPCWQADLAQPLMLVVGGEAEGAGAETLQRVDEKLSIPMPGKFESLNAGVAASILMFEVVRQRSR